MIKNLIALLIGTVLSLLILEVFFSLYNPFGFRQSGDRIVLPSNYSIAVDNNEIPGLDSVIIHTKNSLGFRGEELGSDFEDKTSFIAVGGSTTECFLNSDGKDWVSLLSQRLKKVNGNIWMNNAGYNGHSTYGHQILIEDIIVQLKPDFVVLLVGCNDIERTDLTKGDNRVLKRSSSIKSFLRNNSQLIDVVLNLKRSVLANKRGLWFEKVEFEELPNVDSIAMPSLESIKESQKTFNQDFRKRLLDIILTLRTNDIEPILITQPSLVGEGYDPVTNIDLEKIQYCDDAGGYVYWQKLETYNAVTREVAEKEHVHLIDLAQELTKSTDLFFDCVHFTNQGNVEVARLIYDGLQPILMDL